MVFGKANDFKERVVEKFTMGKVLTVFVIVNGENSLNGI